MWTFVPCCLVEVNPVVLESICLVLCQLLSTQQNIVEAVFFNDTLASNPLASKEAYCLLNLASFFQNCAVKQAFLWPSVSLTQNNFTPVT